MKWSVFGLKVMDGKRKWKHAAREWGERKCERCERCEKYERGKTETLASRPGLVKQRYRIFRGRGHRLDGASRRR